MDTDEIIKAHEELSLAGIDDKSVATLVQSMIYAKAVNDAAAKMADAIRGIKVTIQPLSERYG